MTYLTSMKLNASDDKIIEKFNVTKAELIDSEKGIYGKKSLSQIVSSISISQNHYKKNSWKQRQELF